MLSVSFLHQLAADASVFNSRTGCLPLCQSYFLVVGIVWFTAVILSCRAQRDPQTLSESPGAEKLGNHS